MHCDASGVMMWSWWWDFCPCFLSPLFLSPKCEFILHARTYVYINICMCVLLIGILYKWVGGVAVLINLLLLKQSKCKLELSICVSQTIMRREFKWPGCFFIRSDAKLKFTERRLLCKQRDIMYRREKTPLRLYQYGSLSVMGWRGGPL